MKNLSEVKHEITMSAVGPNGLNVTMGIVVGFVLALSGTTFLIDFQHIVNQSYTGRTLLGLWAVSSLVFYFIFKKVKIGDLHPGTTHWIAREEKEWSEYKQRVENYRNELETLYVIFTALEKSKVELSQKYYRKLRYDIGEMFSNFIIAYSEAFGHDTQEYANFIIERNKYSEDEKLGLGKAFIVLIDYFDSLAKEIENLEKFPDPVGQVENVL